jgi:NADH-quinone oxidoreductase subunit G
MMIEIEIDGKKVEVPSGSMVMDAANKVGTYIPHFCYHKKLSIAANCRMCLVEVEKAPKPLPACATPVAQGMIVRSHSDKAISAQKSVMEFLLINHPLDCPICDQGGECQLQDIAVGYGASASRYQEEKRIVTGKDAGPLVSMEEMSRCIHCTRCVRFGQEIAGVMEFGMLNRGEHSEITAFVGKTVDSELSGNMIDLCPVGALTSKPFRYQARTWELSRRKSVSPHDSLGSNLIVQVKGGKVKRVLPLENESINECWLSDKDRFSYEGLNSEDRLTAPMIKQGGAWKTTDWKTALEYVAHGIRNIKHEHGANVVAAVGTGYSTLEELSLLQKIMSGIESDNIDFRLRQSDFRLDGRVVPWLGMSITEFSELKNVFVVGSFLRKDHPLLAARLRRSIKSGTRLDILHTTDDDLLMPIANKIICSPKRWLQALSEVMAAVAEIKGVTLPVGFEGMVPSREARNIAQNLVNVPSGVFLGNAAVAHAELSQLHAALEWIATHTGARLGYLTEGANTLGGYLVNATGAKGGLFNQSKKAYLLLNAEPLLDAANPQLADEALKGADMVVVMSPYKQGLEYADVLLPIAPFSETSGSFVNCEGRLQSFNGTVKPLGDTRPAWKVLRVLGNLLELPGFEYETSEAVRDELLAQGDIAARLNNISGLAPSFLKLTGEDGLMRVADVPIYFSDAIVRRSLPLQATADAKVPEVKISSNLLQQLGLKIGDKVVCRQGLGSAEFVVNIEKGLPDDVVRLAAGHISTARLGDMFGAIVVERL